MDISPADVAKLDQLVAAMRSHAEVLGEFKRHLEEQHLSEAEVEAILIGWNQAIVDTIFCSHE